MMTASTVWTLAFTTPFSLITSFRPTDSSPPISHSISMESAMSNFPSIRADSPTIVRRLVAEALLPSPLVEPLRPSIVEPPCVERIPALSRLPCHGVLPTQASSHARPRGDPRFYRHIRRDRKSTRLNSSHTVISYAVFCLKKKKKINGYTL